MNLLTICNRCANNHRDLAVKTLVSNKIIKECQKTFKNRSQRSEIAKALEDKITEISGQVPENSVSDFKDSLHTDAKRITAPLAIPHTSSTASSQTENETKATQSKNN